MASSQTNTPPPPHFAPICIWPNPLPAPHSPNFIPPPTPMFTKVYPQTQPASFSLPSLLTIEIELGQGRGVTQCKQHLFTPFSILTPSLKFFVPPSPLPFFTAFTFSKPGRMVLTKMGGIKLTRCKLWGGGGKLKGVLKRGDGVYVV